MKPISVSNGRGRAWTRAWWFVGLLVLAGCSSASRDKWREGLAPAHRAGGRVAYNGKPLEGATVVFITKAPGSNRTIASTGRTDAEGRFTLRTYAPGDGAVAGQHQVMITKTVMVSPTGHPLAANPQGEFLETPVEKTLIPDKYRSPTESGLAATVVPGQSNEFEFLLSDS